MKRTINSVKARLMMIDLSSGLSSIQIAGDTHCLKTWWMKI